MANAYARQLGKKVPQSEPLPGQSPNSAGGHAFEVDDWQRLRRFLVLGTEGGTYYASERELTLDNCAALERCVKADGFRAVNEIEAVSTGGLAPKNDPAVFALALASVRGDAATRRLALGYLPAVCRTGTHLFQFAACREALGGGWGRGARRAVADWYLEMPVDKLVHRCLKYRQRDGWSHRDLLRLAHPRAYDGTDARDNGTGQINADRCNLVFDAVCAPEGGMRTGPSKAAPPGDGSVVMYGANAPYVRETAVRGIGGGWAEVAQFSSLAEGYLRAQAFAAEGCDAQTMARIVARHGLERELVPSEYLNRPEVQAAMLPSLGLTALVRNLGNYARSGLLKPLSECERDVLARLGDAEAMRASRVHPFQLLLAARAYASGRGVRSQGPGWVACPRVVEALDVAFEASFSNVEPTGKRFVLGVDVSSSMRQTVAGSPVTCAEAAAAMALVTIRTEPDSHCLGFSTQVRELKFSARSRLTDVLAQTTRQVFGGTDCAAAIRWASDNKIAADAFVVYTDSETWAGDEHASAAIRRYRKESGVGARLAVVAFSGSRHSVADGSDPGSMDFVGLDASLPQALAAFAKE